MKRNFLIASPLLTLLCFGGVAHATTYTDNFSGAQATLDWKALDYACLTAGSGTGSIPKCASPNDNPGYGALRLTPAVNEKTGAILSNFSFPLNQGLQVTFTTYTYGGDSGGTAGDGADGITFFMTDGTQPVPSTAGALGGSLGYSCSNINSKYEGLANAYLGLGIDEFGNFLNSGDNTNTGVVNTHYSGDTSFGFNTWYNGGHQYQPMRIGLRGAGNLTWAYLQSLNPDYYSGSPNKSKLTAVCRSGKYVNDDGDHAWLPAYTNYAVIPGGYRVLPNSQKIAKESATTRTDAYPITYKITISPSGLLNFAYSYNNGAFTPVLANRLITQDNGPLPSALRFGFSSGTGGSNNVHEITCFQASPLQSNSSAATNTIQSGEVKIGSQVYLATYTPDNWWGSVQSLPLVTTNGTLSISTQANWDASCVLTGGACPAMGTDANGNATTTVTAESPSSRQLMTWNPTSGQGVGLQWSNLTTTQQTALNSTDSLGQDRVSWLRGTRSVEQLQSPPGNLRARTKVLGDVIDSSPTFVGAPVSGTLPDSFADALYSNASIPEAASGAQSYSAFVTAQTGRTNMVYVGANDGFLHGFEAGAYDSSGSYVSTLNDGKELLGYLPSGLLTGSKLVNLTSPVYTHDFYVDATPGVGDLFYGNAWHTWLVGGVGTAGSEIYALDITNPGNFSEPNAASLVKGDWIGGSGSLSHLGKTVGTPIIVRMHNGQWAIIFGNGLDSGQTAGVYIGLVDSTTGAVTFQFLDTKIGSSTSANGIAYVTSADLDGDHIVDYLYGGDLQGNVWRFDVTSKNSNSWSVSKFGASGANNFNPLFVAKDASSNLQPITTSPVVASVRTGNTNRLMVFFGTGHKTPFTASQGDQYASGTQTFYGIWDYDMSNWNSMASIKYATLSGTQSISRSTLLQQALVSQTTGSGNGQVLGYRTLPTSSKVCWKGSTDCASNNNEYGWYFDLPDTHEQIIYNPTIVEGAVVVNTAVPPTISAIQCNPGLQTGWTMAFDPASGGGVKNGFFPGISGGFGAGDDGSVTSGIRLDAVGTVTTVKYGGDTYIVTQTVQGAAKLSKVNPPNNENPSRVSWRELRSN
ncbi:PilC/PilY family type IV pilus protein [Dyella sp. KRB-257]|uniref:PilC/PilY family type IV pilus protein n=1 Tax=Dyella sp. KRB-257 TaxID=3400915 RepID=UPI003C015385